MKDKIAETLKKLIREEEAASLVEYALVIAAGAVVATALKPQLTDMLDKIMQGADTQIDNFIAAPTP